MGVVATNDPYGGKRFPYWGCSRRESLCPENAATRRPFIFPEGIVLSNSTLKGEYVALVPEVATNKSAYQLEHLATSTDMSEEYDSGEIPASA